MTDTNEIRFSGTIERLKSINTKTGTAMATFLLKVGQDKFKVVAFKNIAGSVLRCDDGTRISVTGTGSINSWKDKEDHWHNDFQLSAWGIEIHGEQLDYQKNVEGQQPAQHDQPPPPPEPRDEHDYRGGPF